jgi:uncharacterized protein with FMN-binding domain
MKRVILAITSSIASLVILLSFKAHAIGPATTPPAAVSSTGTSGASDTTGSSSASTRSSSTKSSKSSSTSGSGTKSATSAAATYTGTATNTRYGPVQVRVTVKNGKITSVDAVEYPNGDSRDAQINSYAIPQLNSEAQAANSASIDMVSGATYTSEGYIASLQSALNKAGM